MAFFVYRDYFGNMCQGDTTIIWFSQGVNTIFLIFFIKFFVDAYTKRPSKDGQKTTTRTKKD